MEALYKKKRGFGFQSVLNIPKTGLTIVAGLVSCTGEIFHARATLFQMFP